MTSESISQSPDGEGPEKSAGDAGPGSRSPHFVAVAHQFWDTLDALRELHRSMGPLVAELDTKRLTWEELVAVQGLTPEKQRKLAAFVKEREEKKRGGSADPEGQAEGDSEHPESAISTAGVSDEDGKVLQEIFGTAAEKNALARISFKVTRLGLIPDRKWFMNGALLTMAIGAFEVLIGAIRARRHDLHPETLETDKKEFSLSDLRRFDSLAEAESDAISREVEHFLRQEGLAQWIDWYDGATGLDCRGYAIDFATLEEAFQRRHLIVHNAGRVSRLYLSRTADRKSGELEVGQLLPVDDGYLTETLDELDAFGALLLIGAYAKWEPDEASAARMWLLEHTYESMLAGRWRVVKKLANYGKKLRENDESMKWVFHVNEWLACKRLGQLDEVKQEVTDWDNSALGASFRIAKAALLDDLDTAFDEAGRAVLAGAIGEGSLVEWPLLEEMRADGRFDGLRREAAERPDDGHVVLRQSTAQAGGDGGSASSPETSDS